MSKKVLVRVVSNSSKNPPKGRIIHTSSAKSFKHVKFYDLSSKARLIIVDGDIDKQDIALKKLQAEMSEIIKDISNSQGLVVEENNSNHAKGKTPLPSPIKHN